VTTGKGTFVGVRAYVDYDVISSLVDLCAAGDVTPIVLYCLPVFTQLSCVLQKPVTIKASTRVSAPVSIGPSL
jgi:hypothetical protein